MKTFFWIMIVPFVLLVSCKKEKITPEPVNPVQNLHSVKVSSDFSWKTTHSFTAILSAEQSGIATITSVAGMPYQKVYLAKSKPVSVKFAVPATEKSVRVLFYGQVKTVNLGSSTFSVSFTK